MAAYIRYKYRNVIVLILTDSKVTHFYRSNVPNQLVD
jgi:hypothetical protein